MIIGGTTDLDSTVKGLMHLRAYKPFQYGGKWFLAFIDGKGYAFRSMKPITKHAHDAGLSRIDVATIDKQPSLDPLDGK